jgi:hypothetical protein
MTSANSMSQATDSEYSSSTGHTTKSSSQSQMHGLSQFQSQSRLDGPSPLPLHPKETPADRSKPFRRKSFSEFSYLHQPEAPFDVHVVAPDERFIQDWLPLVFSGYDINIVDTFVKQLRDDGTLRFL